MKTSAPSAGVLLAVLFAVLPAAGCSRLGGKGAAQFKTAKVVRTDVVSAIEATGTLEPEDVDIGAQVTGQILSFGKDAKGADLDYGSAVEAGQVLAKIDDVPYSLAKRQAEAQLSLAQANVQAAEANLAQCNATVLQNEAKSEQARAQLAQAEKDWDRARKLGPSDLLSQSAFDTYQGVFETARAGVKSADAACEMARAQAKASQASIAQAQSSIVLAKVAIELADRNLGYCTIASPVKGIVIDRRVDVGQTVVSNLNASSLMLLAKDLRKMQVWASVNEADIGSIHPDQAVAFTVDAFPGRIFKGTVDKVRPNASMTQNVVTYVVEVGTDNADGKLRPYLTANAKFEIARQADVLAVPSAALRWQPDAAQVAPGVENPLAADEGAKPADKTANADGGGKKPGGRKKSLNLVWVKDGPDGQFVKPIRVKPGISDGVVTQITPVDEGAVLEGQEIVVGQERAAQGGDAAAKSPFQTSMGGRH